jgi:hypothetical protein
MSLAQRARSWWRSMTATQRQEHFPTIPPHLAWHVLTEDQKAAVKAKVWK